MCERASEKENHHSSFYSISSMEKSFLAVSQFFLLGLLTKGRYGKLYTLHTAQLFPCKMLQNIYIYTTQILDRYTF